MTTTQGSLPEPEPVSAHGQWCLQGRLTEESESHSIPLSPLPFRVGRRPGLSLTLPHQTVSGVHAEIFPRKHYLFARDLGSTNGTFINGVPLLGEQQLREKDLLQFANVAFRVARQMPAEYSHTRSANACDQALALVQFDRLLEQGALTPHFQPIIDLQTMQAVAFEALARSRFVGLETPEFMFAAAAHLGRLSELSQLMRLKALESSGVFPTPPHLFLNTHPSETSTQELLETCEELRRISPMQRMTLELHEAATSRVGEIKTLRDGLDAMDIRLAFDDFGIGQTRLADLAEVRPHYLKFDRSLIRRLNPEDEPRARVIRGLVATVREIGILPLAEGVETEGEARACVDLGFAFAQGYFYGKPMPPIHYSTAHAY